MCIIPTAKSLLISLSSSQCHNLKSPIHHLLKMNLSKLRTHPCGIPDYDDLAKSNGGALRIEGVGVMGFLSEL